MYYYLTVVLITNYLIINYWLSIKIKKFINNQLTK